MPSPVPQGFGRVGNGELILPASSRMDVQSVNGGERAEGDSVLLFKKEAAEKNILVLPETCAFFDSSHSQYLRLASVIREEWDSAIKSTINSA